MIADEDKKITENIAEARARIAKAALKAGKKPEDIMLVAATKMNDTSRVRTAINAGLDACGENRVQELLSKYEENAYEGCPLHFIGTLQSNKVKYLIGKVSMIESVSSLKLASVINKEAAKAGIIQDILLEINIGSEPQKLGIDPKEIEETVRAISQMSNIRVKGLMAIPPKPEANQDNSYYFDRMYQLFIDIRAKKYDNISMDYLSMGMSADYETAIFCGANIVRLGTAIFGARHY